MESRDVHDPKKCILFRNFVELIVRLSYLKYGNLTELHRAIERVIVNKLTPFYERKKAKVNQSEDETKSNQLRSKVNFEDYVTEFEPLFNKYATQRDSSFGSIDKTITLGAIFNLL